MIFVNLPYTDYGARMYNGTRWFNMEPLAEQYPSISPCAYCNNNPAVFVDLNGEEWAYYSVDGKSDPTWNWVDGNEYRTGVKDDNGNEVVLPAYEAVVVFDGSMDEQLGEGDNLYGEGAILADVTVYGPRSADDVKQYNGYTMSSNRELFGVVADGDYMVERLKSGDAPGSYGSYLTLNRRGRVPAMNNYNPAYPNRNPGYVDGIFIHRSNNDGWAGAKYIAKENRWSAVSKGCLLIMPHQWNDFTGQLKTVNKFFLQLRRR